MDPNTVGNQLTWDPRRFMHTRDYYGWNAIFLIQHAFGVGLNVMVVSAAIRSRSRLIRAPADLIWCRKCSAVNVALGVSVASLRGYLALEWQWPFWVCELNSSFNTFSVVAQMLLMFLMSAERIVTIVLARPVPTWLALSGIGGALLTAFLTMILHSYLWWTAPVVSATGFASIFFHVIVLGDVGFTVAHGTRLYCYSAALGTPVALLDLLFIGADGVAIVLAYALIVTRLKSLHVATQSKELEALDAESGLAIVSTAKASIVRLGSNSTGSPVSILDSAALSPSAGSPRGRRTNRNIQSVSELTNSQSRASVQQRRVAARGALAFLASGFTLVPLAIHVGTIYVTKERDANQEFALILLKYFTECTDPLILLFLDPRFRSAVADMYFWWVPSRQQQSSTAVPTE